MGHLETLLDAMERSMESDELSTRKKYGVSVRYDCMQIQYIDMLAEKFEIKRAELLYELSTSAVMDAMEHLGVTEEFVGNLKSQKAYEEGLK